VSVVRDALLRTQPLLTAATNGVQVTTGDKVLVLDRVTCDLDQVLFLQIQTGRKKGWIRFAYCKAV